MVAGGENFRRPKNCDQPERDPKAPIGIQRRRQCDNSHGWATALSTRALAKLSTSPLRADRSATGRIRRGEQWLARNVGLAQDFESFADQNRGSALRIIDMQSERGQPPRPG